jgi:S-formylglutathione hydrolase
MRFSVFVPEQAKSRPAGTLYFLAGLTCTEETFMIKAGAQRFAARHGIILVAPDTSPRDTGIPGEAAEWDFGAGAGFYVDATCTPWSHRFRMHDYVVHELRELIASRFPSRLDRTGIFGHSMGGHGALTLALRNPGVYRSVSAFAPIAAPSRCPWGQKAFTNYLGAERSTWDAWDASALMARLQCPYPEGILIDQGLEDKFLHQGQLLPECFAQACALAGQPLTLRRQPGYDHGYYFITSFIEDHLAFHAARLTD